MSDIAITMEAPASTAGVLVEVTTEIAAAYIARNAVPPGELPALISTVHGTLSGLGRSPETVAELKAPVPPVSVRKSVTDSHLISLEDGKPYKTLKRHLRNRGLTPADYRAKWGLPSDYPMVAPAYARARSALAKETGLGALRRRR